MSSYGSMTPPGETSPALDRYEPQFFCGPTHVQGSPMETHMYWQGSNLEPEYEHRELYHDTGHYIGRSYGYEDVQMTPPADAYGDAYSQHQSIIQHNMHNNNNVECEYSHQPPPHAPHSYVRVVKRRNTANKKERRRTQSINTAFSDLRDCIPNVPHDTKLSKRRNSANGKERRRTQSINTAFSDLRDCIPNVPHDTKLSKKERRRTQSVNTAFSDLRERIPNVPQDTKLSKIKTLRLATSYISYLMRVLECDSEPAGGWSAELQHPAPRRQRHQHALQPTIRQDCDGGGGEECKRTKGRTGWPQHVWALELKQEQNIQA